MKNSLGYIKDRKAKTYAENFVKAVNVESQINSDC